MKPNFGASTKLQFVSLTHVGYSKRLPAALSHVFEDVQLFEGWYINASSILQVESHTVLIALDEDAIYAGFHSFFPSTLKLMLPHHSALGHVVAIPFSPALPTASLYAYLFMPLVALSSATFSSIAEYLMCYSVSMRSVIVCRILT